MILKFNKDNENKTTVDKYKHVDKTKVDREKLCEAIKKKQKKNEIVRK